MSPVPIPLCRKWHTFLTIAVPHLSLCLNISLIHRREPTPPSPVSITNPEPTVAALYHNTRLYHGILGFTAILIAADYFNTVYWGARLSQKLKVKGACLIEGVPPEGVYLL